MHTNLSKNLLINLVRMATVLTLLAGMLSVQPASTAYAVGETIYVKANATGTSTGTSWTNAYTGLQSALAVANAGDQVWVAAGTYKPTPGTDRTATFTLETGVALYGGFAGTETSLSQRNPSANVTILSGNLGNQALITDNSFHVVTGSNTGSTAILDGFTITAGNSNGDLVNPYGGGITTLNGSPTFSNLIITGNKSLYGGGMFNFSSSPTVTNVIFTNNTADRAGAMYNNNNSHAVLVNVVFSNNTAIVRGGAMTTSGSHPTLTNVTFNGNTAPTGGALHNYFNGDPVLVNVTFSSNTASGNGGAIYNEDSSPSLTNVTISGNTAGTVGSTTSGGGIFNEESSPVITNSIIYNNTGGEIFDDLSTPTVTYSLVKGGYTGATNIDGNPVLGTLQNNGGFTQTMALGTGSDAIDAGNNGSCPLDDQRGVSRPQGLQCDMGAYEADNEAPETTLNTYPPNPDSDNTPSFTFSADDGGGSGIASFMCRMDGGGYNPCTSPYTSTPLANGSHTFFVYAIDNSSNEDESPASYTWELNYTPTLVSSIVRAGSTPSGASSVNFTVTFSASVTGVDTSDFGLTTSGVSGAYVSGVSGAGITYTVSVSTGLGNGSIRLDIPAGAGIVDTFGNALTNLPYTGGESYSISKNPTFADVPFSHPYYADIEILYANGLTGGCGTAPLIFCPNDIMNRAQSAVFMVRGMLGAGYIPAAPVHKLGDNWTLGTWAEPWAEAIIDENLSTGCSTSPFLYCPWEKLPREQVVIFGLRMKYGVNYQPPAATGTLFADMTDPNYYATRWAEKAYIDGLLPACGTSGGKPLFCPRDLVSRGLGAYVIVRAKNLSMP